MTPEQQIKLAMLTETIEWFKDSLDQLPNDFVSLLPVTEANIDDAWWAADNCYQDVCETFREGEVETDIECEYSRHYESKSVAAIMPDGEWVGWTYYYGGGKHGEPAAMEWMSEAYELDCVETEETVTVRKFTKVKVPNDTRS